MHIRPYVDLPEPEPEPGPEPEQGPGPGPETGSGEGAVAAPGGQERPGEDGAPQPDLAPFARCGTSETAELPVIPEGPRTKLAGLGLGRNRAGGSGRDDARIAAEQEAVVGARHGHEGGNAHRAAKRRRPTTAVLAAVGVVAALGAGLLTTQALTDDEDSGDDRSLSTEDRSLTEIPTGAPTRVAPSSGADDDAHPSGTPSRAQGSGTPRANRDSEAHTGRDVTGPSATPTRTSEGSGSSSGSGSRHDDGGRGRGDGDGRTGGDRDPSRERPSGPTLRAGDSGPEVSELQRRLKQAGYLDAEAPEDGNYSTTVTEAVVRYQYARHITGDPDGEYGPYTRRELEAETSG
ncbi:hypothetical protein GCM10027091_67410 [Streptomyces daliensis]